MIKKIMKIIKNVKIAKNVKFVRNVINVKNVRNLKNINKFIVCVLSIVLMVAVSGCTITYKMNDGEKSDESSIAEVEIVTEAKTESNSDLNNDSDNGIDNGAAKDTKDSYISYTFRNDKLLQSHYEKHGIDMGFDSKEDYEKAASDVVNNKNALHKKEKEDNDDIYYLEKTNEFVVVSTDGYLRTYFYPDAGKKYYDRQ